MLIIDFETKSRCPLKTAGSYNYAQDLSTDILCCSFVPQNPEDDREFLWYPSDGQLPDNIVKLINDADLIAAHNAGFDRLIWEFIGVNDYGFPEVEFDRWYCTSAQMRVNNLPASLEDAARALDASQKKDHRGAALIRALSVPQKDGTFRGDPELLKVMGAYCLQDSLTTKAIVNATRLMMQVEHDDWLNNEEINDRGAKIDRDLANAAQHYAADEVAEIAAELSDVTDGAVTKHTQSARAVKWVAERVEDHVLSLMTKYVNGERKLTLDKQARANLLDADTLDTIQLSEDVYTVVSLIDEGNQSSVSKFKNMALRADVETDKVHGAFVYAGASQTLRYCIAEGSKIAVLDAQGVMRERNIEHIMLDDLVWDGVEYVAHEGLSYAGYKDVMTHDGVEATYDHKIITEMGATRTILDAYERGDKIKTADRPTKDRIHAGNTATASSNRSN